MKFAKEIEAIYPLLMTIHAYKECSESKEVCEWV